MSVQQLELRHRRYADLSNRFRAAWAFHQYLGSLVKVFPQLDEGQEPSDLPEIHGELKRVYQRLSTGADEVSDELDRIEARLDRRLRALAAQDSRVAPSLLRQFFYRVRNQDDQILRELVKFYVYAHSGGEWGENRLDKVDFLLTKLVEERDGDGPYALGHPGRMRELLGGLWSLLGGDGSDRSDATVAAELGGRLAELRAELADVATLDELAERRVVERFRKLKHGLGGRYFQPAVALEVLETNLAFKNLIRKLSRLEERRIATEYQRLFDLEQEAAVDRALAEELESFRGEVEAFERRLQREELKIGELTRLRSRVRTLTARITSGQGGGDPVERTGEATEGAGTAKGDLAESLDRIRDVLDASDLDLPVRRVAVQPEVFDLRLEPREVLAYRRLAERAVEGEEADVERLVLEAAALRLRINQEAEAIKGLLDATAATGEAAVFDRARRAVHLGGEYLGRLAAAAEQALVRGRSAEAQVLTLLRMRLVRDHAGLWLLAQRPLLRGIDDE